MALVLNHSVWDVVFGKEKSEKKMLLSGYCKKLGETRMDDFLSLAKRTLTGLIDQFDCWEESNDKIDMCLPSGTSNISAENNLL